MKKSILVLIAVFAISLSSFGQETLYNYGHAYSYKTKKLYISSIISHSFEEDDTQTSTGFYNQWVDKFKAACNEKYYDYSYNVDEWRNSRREIEKHRNQQIAEAKEKNWSIVYVKNFNFYDD